VLNLWWLYLSAVVGGVLMVLYGFITLSDVLSGRGPWGELVKGAD
jgi:TRAP-type C4-dicarboxylate transport system permease small subunit